MKLCDIVPATDGVHKYKAIFCNCINGETKCKNIQRKVVYFGAANFKDYTIYSKTTTKEIADAKKASYIARHSANEDFDDPMTAGSLARYILWNLPTFEASLADYKKRFNM